MRKQLLMLTLTVAAFAADEPRNSRVLPASCDAVWPHAIRVFTSNGFGLKASDRAGGVLALEYQQGQQVKRWGTLNDLVAKYTSEKAKGMWVQYKGFRIVGANAIALPEGDGCRYQVDVTFHGWERRRNGEGWWVLKSNGSFEAQLLDEIEKAVAPKD